MKKELQNSLGRIYLSIEYDDPTHTVINNWMGYQTFDSIVAGANACADVLGTHQCPYLLNDNRQVTGPWNHAVEWIATDWTPRAIANGLRCFAHVVNPDSLAEISSEEMQQSVSGFQMQIFGDVEEARKWLQMQMEAQMQA